MAEHIEDALRKIRTSREYTHNIVASVPSILIILSNKLNTLFANNVFEKLNEQFPSLTLKQFITPLEEEIGINLRQGGTLKKEFRQRNEDERDEKANNPAECRARAVQGK